MVKQEVFVIGRALKDLVPFSTTFAGPEYAVTLVEARDVVARATALAARHDGWYLLILSSDEETNASRLEQLAPSTSLVIEDGEDPLIALAHLIAVETWEDSAPRAAPAQTALKSEGPRV